MRKPTNGVFAAVLDAAKEHRLLSIGTVLCAAASVLAKTHRDEYMLRLAEEYPQYGWKKNKGYPTREHRLAIREYGLTPHHRLSFSHGIGQLELQF